MILAEKYRRTAEEFETYYSSYDAQTEELLALLEDYYAKHKDDPSYLLKTGMHELLCDHCKLHLFDCSPFFFEISSGRSRYTWGGLQSPVGSFLDNKTHPLWLWPYWTEIEPDINKGYYVNWRPVGNDHHCPGYDTILAEGFEGILSRAKEGLAEASDEKTHDFFAAVIRSIHALLSLAQRFSAEASEKAAESENEELRVHYEKIAEAAAQVPAKPPRTFYEALCAVLFCREVIGSLEGIGISTFGHLDRMLFPYYRDDIEAGRTTREEVKDLLHALLLYTDIRFDMWRIHHETSTTIILGGCDRDGNVVYNELTDLFLEVLTEGHYIGTKINCRISKKHPRVYFEKLAAVQLDDLPVIVMQNDDTLIASRVMQGQAIEDSRLYVSGGCHEIVLQNTEVNTRADSWISLPRILLDTIVNSRAASFEDFYRDYRRDVQTFYDRIIAVKNKYETFWCQYNPYPLYSSTLTGCIESGKDATEGGAKYSSTALSLVGAATMIDSLYSIRHLVYETKKLTLTQLGEILASDFADQEPLRQYIIHKIPKYGTNDPVINAFSAQVLADLSTIAEGRINARGGKYLPAFYPHDIFLRMGQAIGATPDGRQAGKPLSRGCSPSEFIETENPLNVIHALGPIDFTKYADSFVAEMTLPHMEKDIGTNVLCAIIEAFLEQGGSSLQFNLLDKKLLREAQKHPEEHADIVVRICGYSEVFIFLSPDQQEEVMNRAVR